MTTPYDIISREQVKVQLVIDFDDRDLEIERLILTAIGLVEQYTDYRLWQRDEIIPIVGCECDVYLYPYAITSVQKDGIDISYTTCNRTLSTKFYAPHGSIITLAVGYEETPDIPGALIDAAYKMIVYLADNKDMYSVQLPVDIQLMLNPYKRSPAI